MVCENHNIGKTAVLFFARSPGSEAKEKRILNSSQRNKSLFALLNGTLQKELKTIAFDVIYWNEKHQKGNSFAHRFMHAFESIYKRGYKSIISIGNDTPDLCVADILCAAEALASGKNMVLGPSTDGGAYLIGLNQDLFNRKAFENISWQTKHVFEELRLLCNDALILETKIDLDNQKSLFKFLKVRSFLTSLGKRIMILLMDPLYGRTPVRYSYSLLSHFQLHSRPPP